MSMIGKIVGWIVVPAVGLAVVLFLLVTVWKGDRIALHCTTVNPRIEEFGLVYEREPAWVRFWSEDDGTVFLESKAGIYVFFHVKEDSQQVLFSSEFGARDSGRLSKIDSRARIALADGRGTYSGKCKPAPDLGLD